jgi:multiple sugar transport system ATP-binding protein
MIHLDRTSMAAIVLENIHKQFARTRAPVLDDVSLSIASGEFFVIIGRSGCGKTTTLRIIAGLEQPTRGRVLIDDTDMTRIPPGQRRVAMVMQDYPLYPHLTVRRNLEFASRRSMHAQKERAARNAALTEQLGISEVLDQKPGTLSGGERQRAALARALVVEPACILLDEPLSQVDHVQKDILRLELREVQRRTGATMILVTHDQTDAMMLADRIAVLDAGRIRQIAPPLALFDAPVDQHVAAMFGEPAINLLHVESRVVDRHLEISLGSNWVTIGDGQGKTSGWDWAGEMMLVGIRPHAVRPATAGAEEIDLGESTVDHVCALGARVQVKVTLPDGQQLRYEADPSIRPQVGQRVRLVVARVDLHIFTP